MAQSPDDETPTTRPRRAMSLERQAAGERSAIPLEVDAAEDTTARIGRALFGRRPDARAEDDLIDRFAERVAARARRGTIDEVKLARKKSSLHDWLRFGLGAAGLAGAILAAWIGLRDKVAERPTFADVKEQLAPLRAQQADQDRELRQQRDILLEVRGTVQGIAGAVDDLKPKPRRR